MPYLVHKDKDGATIQFWNLHEGTLTVGRGTDTNGQVDDAKLSRKHFVVTSEAAGFTLKDLGGPNGTLVNGKPVTEQVLKPNDQVRAGDSVFQFFDGLTTMAAKLDQDIQGLGKFAADGGAPAPKS